jgi:hypothetical protein
VGFGTNPLGFLLPGDIRAGSAIAATFQAGRCYSCSSSGPSGGAPQAGKPGMLFHSAHDTLAHFRSSAHAQRGIQVLSNKTALPGKNAKSSEANRQRATGLINAAQATVERGGQLRFVARGLLMKCLEVHAMIACTQREQERRRWQQQQQGSGSSAQGGGRSTQGPLASLATTLRALQSKLQDKHAVWWEATREYHSAAQSVLDAQALPVGMLRTEPEAVRAEKDALAELNSKYAAYRRYLMAAAEGALRLADAVDGAKGALPHPVAEALAAAVPSLTEVATAQRASSSPGSGSLSALPGPAQVTALGSVRPGGPSPGGLGAQPAAARPSVVPGAVAELGEAAGQRTVFDRLAARGPRWEGPALAALAEPAALSRLFAGLPAHQEQQQQHPQPPPPQQPAPAGVFERLNLPGAKQDGPNPQRASSPISTGRAPGRPPALDRAVAVGGGPPVTATQPGSGAAAAQAAAPASKPAPAAPTVFARIGTTAPPAPGTHAGQAAPSDLAGTAGTVFGRLGAAAPPVQAPAAPPALAPAAPPAPHGQPAAVFGRLGAPAAPPQAAPPAAPAAPPAGQDRGSRGA